MIVSFSWEAHTYMCTLYVHTVLYLYMYVCTYMYFHYVICIRCCTYVFPVASSITDAEATVITTDAPSLTYSINVTCTVHPESDADVCKLIVVHASGQSISGVYIRMCIHTYACTHVYVMNVILLCFLYIYALPQYCMYVCIIYSNVFVTGPTKIDHVSANYTELYFC